MANFQGVIFDLDGTLLDSLTDIADCANEALEKMGFPIHPVADYRYFVGDGVRTLMERILPENARKDPQALAQTLQLYVDAYAVGWDRKTRPYPGIPELLDTLTARGVKKAVFSNKPAECTARCVEKLLASWTFEEVVGQKDGVIPKKPDPAGGLWIMERWGAKPEEILYVGDTATDMETAQNAGFVSVGVTWGFRPEEELRDAGARFIIHLPMELAPLLDRQTAR